MENNIITATFTDDSRVARTRYAYQYDYGQLLKVEGIEDLPSAFEVHFSNDEFGTATTQIGTDSLVSIPDAYLLPGTMIFAWIFLHSGEDDGETVYRIKIPVRARAEVSDTPPTPQEQSVITETISALNAGVARAEAAAEEIENMEVEAETLQPGSSAYSDWSDGTLTLGIPRGDKGEKGDPGTGVPTGGTQGQVLTKKSSADNDTEWADPSGAVTDVQVRGESVVTDGVATIPVSGTSQYGVVRTMANGGLSTNGYLAIQRADPNKIKSGVEQYAPIVPNTQHYSAFYGLAKAAGHDERSSSLALGTYSEEAKTAIKTMIGVEDPEIPVEDVQVDGTSIVSDGVAEIPTAGNEQSGVVKLSDTYGGLEVSNGYLRLVGSTDDQIKSGFNISTPIVPRKQDVATFYGLATAAGDATQKSSQNPVGTYTDNAKTRIKAMIGVPEIDDTAGAGDTGVTWSADKITEELAGAGTVQDVQINGTSIISDGVANIQTGLGLGVSDGKIIPRTTSTYGIVIGTDGYIKLYSTAEGIIKTGTATGCAVVVGRQHNAVFYGLAKAAGDTTQSQSSNPVGTYTDNAKSAIKAMLDIGGETQTVTVSGTTPAIRVK